MFMVGRAVFGLEAACILQGALSIIGWIVELEKDPDINVVISVLYSFPCV